MTLPSITVLTDKGIKFNWSKSCDDAFQRMNALMAEATMVSLPKYGQNTDVRTDTSKYQIGTCVSQEEKPFTLFSRKFNSGQKNYLVGEKGLLVIVETLRYFKTMLKGQKITIWTDYLNLTFPDTPFTCDRFLRQRWVLEGYGVDIEYIRGDENVVVDAMSRLPFEDEQMTRTEEVMLNRRSYEFDTYPISVTTIHRAQQDNEKLQ